MSQIFTREFAGAKGSVTVSHVVVKAEGENFVTQLQDLRLALQNILADCNQTPVFARIFLSDAANQADLIGDLLPCPVSIIEQPPLCPCKCMAILFLESGRKGESAHFYTAGLSPAADSHDATVRILEEYARDVNLADECVRTWFFVNDIDNNYAGMVRGRNEVFARSGLTKDTHFIASTGIAGRTADHHCPVSFDAYAVRGITPDRITYLKALTHLNPTMEYGVAFERATALDFADRRVILVSGTASINNKGEIEHPGDIVAQTRRMVENVEALLHEGGAELDNLLHAIVYLRDPGDYLTVGAELDRLLPVGIPRVVVNAPVCRPGWLVEMECMAFIGQNRMDLPSY